MTNSATSSPGATSRMFVLMALALGILATVLAFVFIQSGANADSGPSDEIIVAKHDISPNAPLEPDRDLEMRKMPRSYGAVRQGMIEWDRRASFKGQRVNRDVRPGQPLMIADFAAVGDLQLVEPYFALQIQADTGMIIPGDRVKAIVPRPVMMGAATDTAPSTEPLVLGPKEGFRVLAVGGYLSKTRAQVTNADQYNSATANQKSVTLEVTEDQAKELVGATSTLNSQKVTLLLCPSDLTKPPAPVTPAAPMSAPAETRPRPSSG